MKKSLLAALAFLFLGTAALQGCFVGWHDHDRGHHRHDGYRDGDRSRGDDRSRWDGGHRRGDD